MSLLLFPHNPLYPHGRQNSLLRQNLIIITHSFKILHWLPSVPYCSIWVHTPLRWPRNPCWIWTFSPLLPVCFTLPLLLPLSVPVTLSFHSWSELCYSLSIYSSSLTAIPSSGYLLLISLLLRKPFLWYHIQVSSTPVYMCCHLNHLQRPSKHGDTGGIKCKFASENVNPRFSKSLQRPYRNFISPWNKWSNIFLEGVEVKIYHS